MDDSDWKKMGELFATAATEELSLFAFVTIPATAGTGGEQASQDPTHEVSPVEAAHLVWAKTPREARLIVCFPGGHFINELTGAAIVTLDSKDILGARDSQDIAMLADNLHAMVAQAQLHD